MFNTQQGKRSRGAHPKNAQEGAELAQALADQNAVTTAGIEALARTAKELRQCAAQYLQMHHAALTVAASIEAAHAGMEGGLALTQHSIALLTQQNGGS